MPYNRPIPDSKHRRKAGGLSSDKDDGGFSGGGFLGAWVQAEKMIQIALVLPCAGFIGWVAGAGLDHLLHQTWVAMAGVVVGIIAGLIGAIRMAIFYASGSDGQGKNGDGPEGGNPGNPS